MKYIFSVLFLTITACSVSKPVETTRSVPKVETKKAAPLPPPSQQKALFNLLASTDLSEIENGLKTLAIENFNFTDDNGQSPADILFLLNSSEKSELLSKFGLSIYQSSKIQNALLENDLSQAKHYLDRVEADINHHQPPTTALNPSFQIHRQLIEKLSTAIISDDTSGANQLVRQYQMSCSFAYQTLVLTSIARTTDRHTAKLAAFLSQLGCKNALNTADLNQLYTLEARRIYQDHFTDVGLFRYILNTDSLHDKMISIGDFGLKISPWYLFTIGRECIYSPKNLEPLTDENDKKTDILYYMNRQCNNGTYDEHGQLAFSDSAVKNQFDPIIESCKKDGYSEDCFNGLGFKKMPFNLLLIVDGQRLFSSANETPMEGLDNGVYTQIEGVIYGFNTATSVWKYVFKDAFEPRMTEFAPEEQTEVTIYPYSGKNKELLDEYSKLLESLKKENDLSKRLGTIKAFQMILYKKYLKMYMHIDLDKDDLPQNVTNDDLTLSREDLSVEFKQRLYLFQFMEDLRSTFNPVLKKEMDFKEACADSANNLQSDDKVALYQLSFRQAPSFTLMKWDLIRSTCFGTWPQ